MKPATASNHKYRPTPRVCQCGMPTTKGGEPLKSDAVTTYGCERCLRIEASMEQERQQYAKSLRVTQHPRRGEQGEFDQMIPQGLLIQINKACDAFFEERGLRMPGVSRWSLDAAGDLAA